MTSFARDQLKSVVERIERLEEEKAAVADDIKAVYAEAKGNGFDTKTIRKVIRLRKKTAEERQEEEALLDVYLAALGMTPIERAIAATEEEDEPETEPPKRKGRPRSPAADFARDLAGSEAETPPRRNGRLKDRVADALSAMGTPAELTEEERAKGYTAAFIDKNGTRMAIGTDVRI